MREETRQWFAQASADLKAARDNVVSENFYLVGFLCHQAVEKGLIALLIERHARAPPHSHSLRRLADELDLPLRLQEEVDLLEPAYTDSRYPDVHEDVPAERYSKSDAERMIIITEDLFEWIRKRIAAS